MFKLVKIAFRNLLRYKRRTLLTSSLIAVGVTFVLVFVSSSSAFKNLMISQITDSMLGHIQVHKQGYMASIDSLPLTMNLSQKQYEKLKKAILSVPGIQAYSPRIKFAGMFSNFMETTNIRINGVYPDKETDVVPLLPGRVKQGEKVIKKGEIFIPELLAKGLNVKVGNTVVVIATNRDGSVNGKQFRVGAVIESVTGPGGRDGYIHIEDAKELLRLEEMEVSEVALRLKDFDELHRVSSELQSALSIDVNKSGKPLFDVRTWEALSPFYNVSRMIEVMTFFIRLMLIAIVLISVMNVMIMAVFERIREIGTIAAIGTRPGKILYLFLIEGFFLGVVGTFAGIIITCLTTYIINAVEISFNFGRQVGLILSPRLEIEQIVLISVIVIVVSILAALQPAFKASRMEPINALRHV
ncbi:MAG: FtsX-like permease family protein [Candidatus Aminicenantes bacterium]|nr:FtsX-like permease family protein [Candidatus Aminicenantes bacterium]